MKRLFLLLCGSGALLCAAELAGVHSVYVLPMAHGLDQYLVNRLTNDHVFQVVTDAKLADALFTDRVGESFQAKLEDISPTPAPEKPAPKAEPKKEDKEKEEPPANTLLAEAVSKAGSPAQASAFGRAKGTVFLVDTKSREVVWSVYDTPKDFSSKQLDRTASAIVSRLKRDLNKK